MSYLANSIFDFAKSVKEFTKSAADLVKSVGEITKSVVEIAKSVPDEKGGKHPLLSDRRNIVVIADEAHRSQYDFIDGFAKPFRIAIVRDMWLTGFDAPSLQTIYVDKPMRGHGLMQAIARVNCVFKGKPGGLVVDYLGLAEELKQALGITMCDSLQHPG